MSSDHILYSHEFSDLEGVDIRKRNFTLITVGACSKHPHAVVLLLYFLVEFNKSAVINKDYHAASMEAQRGYALCNSVLFNQFIPVWKDSVPMYFGWHGGNVQKRDSSRFAS